MVCQNSLQSCDIRTRTGVSFSSDSYFINVKTETLRFQEQQIWGLVMYLLIPTYECCLISHHKTWLLPSGLGTAMNIRGTAGSRFCKTMGNGVKHFLSFFKEAVNGDTATSLHSSFAVSLLVVSDIRGLRQPENIK